MSTPQVATAGLVFALLAFFAAIGAISAVVYKYSYDKKDKKDATAVKMPMRPMLARQRMMQGMSGGPASLSESYSELPPQPNLAAVPRVQVMTGAAAAPPIPHTLPSGTVGSFFEDELPQA